MTLCVLKVITLAPLSPTEVSFYYFFTASIYCVFMYQLSAVLKINILKNHLKTRTITKAHTKQKELVLIFVLAFLRNSLITPSLKYFILLFSPASMAVYTVVFIYQLPLQNKSI
jgi:hypothetical protein